MPDFRSVLQAVGYLLIAFSAVTLVPLIPDAVNGGGDWPFFLEAAAAELFVGGAMALGTHGHVFRLRVREAFLLTTGAWFAISAFAAMPLFMRGGMSYTDAFFEAISGLTTTGSTVLTALDTMDPALLFWRSLLQWIGGVGIVVMAIMVLPFLRVGGMQLFQAESLDRPDRTVAQPIRLATYILTIYAGLTAVCALAYGIAGMSAFDALNHAMTTLSTGGYSTHDASLGYFTQPAIPWIGTFFMIAGALPFVLYIKGLRGDWSALWHDQQVRGFIKLVVGVTAALTLWLRLHGSGLGTAIKLAAFNVTSIVSTTGFASADYAAWGAFPAGAFLLLTFLGGCTGSTSGSVKMFRHQVMLLMAREQMSRLISPHAVVSHRYNGRRIPDEIFPSVVMFLAVFVAVIGAVTLALSLFGLDLITSFSGAATAIANVGPGLGPIIGPSGTFASLPDGAKWVLAVGMLLGRLELFTVLVIFTPMFWRS